MIRLEEIKEIRILWDWEIAVIPKQYVKKLQYKEVRKNTYDIECSEVDLVLDLDYIKTHDLICEIGNNKDENATIFHKLQGKQIWNVELITEKDRAVLILPSYRKENYCGKKEILVGQDTENLCEVHHVQDDNYVIQWKEMDEKDVYMSQKEWSIFFQKGMITKISNVIHSLGLELIDKILLQNGEKSLPSVQGSHEGEEYYPLHGLDIFILNVKNNAQHWNFNFILVSDLEKEEKSLYKVIEEGIPNEDTKNYFSRTIIIYDEHDKLEENLFDLNEKLLVITYQELNKMWYTIHKEWNLL